MNQADWIEESELKKEPDDCPMKLLNRMIELNDYYNAPRMNAVLFEQKLDKLAIDAQNEIDARKKEYGL